MHHRLISVPIKSMSALFPKPAGFHVFPQQRAGAEFRITEVLMHHLADGEYGIQADPISPSAKGPTGWLVPSTIARSMASAVATPILQRKYGFVDHAE